MGPYPFKLTHFPASSEALFNFCAHDEDACSEQISIRTMLQAISLALGHGALMMSYETVELSEVAASFARRDSISSGPRLFLTCNQNLSFVASFQDVPKEKGWLYY